MTNKLNKLLGNRIQYLRKTRGFSQEKFAEAINIATTSLSYIETGRGFMTLATLEKMIEVLKVEPYEIFQFSQSKTQEEMYDFLNEKVESIKNDNEKLKKAYTVIKNLL